MPDLQDSATTAQDRNKIFGVRGAARERKPDNGRVYEDKYEDDRLGDELGDEARVWRVLLDEGRAYDATMLPRFRDHLDVDLVFAGLFSAIVTTFVVQTSQPSQPDSGDATLAYLSELIAIQRAWANNMSVNDVPAADPVMTPGLSPWINRCWFLSLVFSLFAAFGAVVVRQWLQEYESDIAGSPRRRALIRHYRHIGLKKWKVDLIVPILPMLLHVSLLLFFIGLILYVRQSDPSMSHGIIALTVLIYFLYLATNMIPVFQPQCPYRSPLSTAGYWGRYLLGYLYVWCEVLLWLAVTSCVNLPNARRNTIRKSISADIRRQEALRTRSPSDYEWHGAMKCSRTLVPDSLVAAIQVSSSLSTPPIVIQAASSLPFIYEASRFEDLPHGPLLRDQLMPWFITALETQRSIFAWAPGRENELQRMAVCLLLCPNDVLDEWLDDVHMGDYRHEKYYSCVSHVYSALVDALLSDEITQSEAPILSATILALGRRLVYLDRSGNYMMGMPISGAMQARIFQAYSSMAYNTPPTCLRLRPAIWANMLDAMSGSCSWEGSSAPFVVVLWRSMVSDPSPYYDEWTRSADDMPPSIMSLHEWLHTRSSEDPSITVSVHRPMHFLLCRDRDACEWHRTDNGTSNESWLHLACRALDDCLFRSSDPRDSTIKEISDDNFGFLTMQFIKMLLSSLKYDSVISTVEMVGGTVMSSIIMSTFDLGSGTPLSNTVRLNAPLAESFATPLFLFLLKLLGAVHDIPDESSFEHSIPRDVDEDKKLILEVMDRHVDKHCDDIMAAFPASDCDTLDLIRPAVAVLLEDPEYALLNLVDALAAMLSSPLNVLATNHDGKSGGDNQQPALALQEGAEADDLVWCIWMDVISAARAGAVQNGARFPHASGSLHQALLSLKARYHDAWSGAISTFRRPLPLILGIALNSPQGRAVLVDLVDDLSLLVAQWNTQPRVEVLHEASQGLDTRWFSRFAANPEDCAGRQLTSLSVRELVTLEEYSRNMGVITDSGTSPNDDEVSAEAAQNETHEEDSNSAVLGARAEQRLSAVGHWVKDCLARARRVLLTTKDEQDMELASGSNVAAATESAV